MDDSTKRNKDEGLIFISWSGDISKQVAMALRELLRNTIQIAKPWLSDSDIDKGARWRSEIETKLEDALAGIIVLTPENLQRPWLLFEAGALSKKIDRVYTYLFRLNASDVGDPLAQFQRTKTEADDTLKMMKSINENLGVRAIEDSRMQKAFRSNWGEFERALKDIPTQAVGPLAAPDPMLEVLSYLREQSKELAFIRTIVASGPLLSPSDYPADLSAAVRILSSRSAKRPVFRYSRDVEEPLPPTSPEDVAQTD